MSISKSLSLNFTDGIKTVYTTSATLYIPFEVSYIRIANTYFQPACVGADPTDAIITSSMVDNDVLAQVKQFSIPNCIKHIFNIPRPINGTYNFTINLSNTYSEQTITTRTGYSLVGTLGIGLDEIILDTVASDDIYFLSFTEDDFETPPGRLIRTGVAPYVLGTNSFNVVSYDSITQIISTSQLSAGNLIGVNWFMAGNLLSTTLGSNLGIGSYSDSFATRLVIKSVLAPDTESRYRINSVEDYSENDATVIWSNTNYYKFYNLTTALVVIDLEFYEKYNIPRRIKNTQYYLWSFTDTTFTDLKNIDVLFPVDEIQIVNFNGHTVVAPDMYNIYSDLIQSSTTDFELTNKNYTNTLATMVLSFSPYNVNRKKFLYNTPRIINGAYSLYAKYASTNVAVDYTNDLGASDFQIHFLFIQYEK